MIINKRTISTTVVYEYSFKFEDDNREFVIEVSVTEGKVNHTIRKNHIHESVSESNWKVIRAFIENDVKEDGKG